MTYEYRVVYLYDCRMPRISGHHGDRERAQAELDSIDLEGEHIVRAWIERRPQTKRWRELRSTVRGELANA